MGKVDAVIRPNMLDSVRAALDEIGDGKIFVTPVLAAVRFRTGEYGEVALS